MLWNAHKAFIKGIFIKLGGRARRKRYKRFTDITNEIQTLEIQNKTNPTPSVTQKLLQLRYELCNLLLEKYEKMNRRVKKNYYASGKRAGKLLGQHLKGIRFKTKNFLYSPITNYKLFHPDAFSNYYGTLYNLQSDPNTFQPTPELISDYLSHVKLPQLSPKHLDQLNTQFTPIEIIKFIDSLPKNKSPGPDGFIYYKTFKHILLSHLETIYNAATASSAFPPEMLKALIVTLPERSHLSFKL